MTPFPKTIQYQLLNCLTPFLTTTNYQSANHFHWPSTVCLFKISSKYTIHPQSSCHFLQQSSTSLDTVSYNHQLPVLTQFPATLIWQSWYHFLHPSITNLHIIRSVQTSAAEIWSPSRQMQPMNPPGDPRSHPRWFVWRPMDSLGFAETFWNETGHTIHWYQVSICTLWLSKTRIPIASFWPF